MNLDHWLSPVGPAVLSEQCLSCPEPLVVGLMRRLEPFSKVQYLLMTASLQVDFP